MKSLIEKNKKISKQRQEFVEHNFEAMVGARKRRYNETPQQKQRTELLEDYYLLYTQNKDKWQKLKEWINENKYKQLDDRNIGMLVEGYSNVLVDVVNVKDLLDKMQELGAEDVED